MMIRKAAKPRNEKITLISVSNVNSSNPSSVEKLCIEIFFAVSAMSLVNFKSGTVCLFNFEEIDPRWFSPILYLTTAEK